MSKLSICVPTYNREKFLKHTLETIIPQITNNDVEIIISDNASTDGTEKYVKALSSEYSFLRYSRNEKNLGMDYNAYECIKRSSSEYCWMFSDDDLLLPGAVEKVLSIIEEYDANFIYVNHAGFLDGEDYKVVLKRGKNKQDIIYEDGEKMIRDLVLNHFTSLIYKKDLALGLGNILEEYKKLDFTHGYSLYLATYIVLMNTGPFVFVGRIYISVRNLPFSKASYSPLTILVDIAKHYQILNKKGIISDYTEHYIVNWFMRGFYRIILPMKCFNEPPGYTKEMEKLIMSLCSKYETYRFYIYPSLALPKWVLILPYWLGRTIKGIVRKFFKLSPF